MEHNFTRKCIFTLLCSKQYGYKDSLTVIKQINKNWERKLGRKYNGSCTENKGRKTSKLNTQNVCCKLARVETNLSLNFLENMLRRETGLFIWVQLWRKKSKPAAQEKSSLFLVQGITRNFSLCLHRKNKRYLCYSSFFK